MLSAQYLVNCLEEDYSDMLSAQYLVNCLEEDHVSHGITIQEPRLRPMKETLHFRHHSTVLPRLGSSRMESHQNLHTHAVDSAIQLQRNNRVLKKRPPPNSEGSRDSTEDNDALSYSYGSGHCHLLQDYKNRVLGELSDICTYCGASPQDVKHLFACTTHPTDLSPADLWRNPVGSTLTDLKTDLVVANNNNTALTTTTPPSPTPALRSPSHHHIQHKQQYIH